MEYLISIIGLPTAFIISIKIGHYLDRRDRKRQ